MKVIGFFILGSFTLNWANAQQEQTTITLAGELRNYYDISILPTYRTNTIEAQTSSYDRTGGNDDGFSGKYSFVRRNPDSSLVIFDQQGPGVVNRIWTATATPDTLDFYIDSDPHPALSVCYMDLFSGKVSPFTPPLCDHQAGGFYCYFPFLFQKHCMIISRAKKNAVPPNRVPDFPRGNKCGVV